MRISQETIREVQARADILDVVEDFVSLKKSGSNWVALSPFSDEKTPSFFVVPSKNIFKDFSSGKGGDVISFVREIEGVSFLGAIEYLAKKYGIDLEEIGPPSSEEEAEEQRKQKIYIVLKFANAFFNTQLQKTDEGRSVGMGYLTMRGVSEEAIHKFSLGYSPQSWHKLEEEALKKGFDKNILADAGLLVSKKDGKHYDRFRGRVMFPIYDLSARVIGFGARTLKKDDKPKYLNSPETPVYHKSRVLYGLFQARNAIRKAENCYLVEGYTDVIALHQSGIENVVSSSGTALTKEQGRILKRFSPRVTLLYDGDPAGMRAAMRGIDLLLATGLDVKIVPLPEKEDPDSFLKKQGKEKFISFLEQNTKDFILFKTDLYLKNAENDPVLKSKLVEDIVSSIVEIPNHIRRAAFFKACAELLSVSENLLIQEGNKLLFRKAKKAEIAEKRAAQKQPENLSAEPPNLPPDVVGIDPALAEKPLPQTDETQEKTDATSPHLQNAPTYSQEREFIRLLVRYGIQPTEKGTPLCLQMLNELQDIKFTTPIFQKMKEEYEKSVKNKQIFSENDFLQHENDEIKIMSVDVFLASSAFNVSNIPSVHWEGKFKIFVPTENENLEKVIYRNLLKLKHIELKKLCREALQEIRNTKMQAVEEDYLQIYSSLKQQRSEIAKILGIVIAP